MSTADISSSSLGTNVPVSAASSRTLLETVEPAAGDRPKESLVVNMWLMGAAILVAIAAFAFFAAALYESLNRREGQLKSMPYAETEIAKLRAQQRQNLSDYRWVNQAEGVLAIPIDRAMQLTVERFKAATEQTRAQPATPPNAR